MLLPALAMLTLSSCGGESVDANAPAATAATTSAPATTPTTTEPAVGIPDASEIGEASSSAVDGDVSPLRALAFDSMVSNGMTEADANCIADALDFDDQRTLQQDPTVIGPVFESCGLPAPDLG